MAIGVVAAVLVGGLVLVGGGIAGAVMLLSDDDGGEEQGWSSTGNVTVATDIASAELFIDNSSRGVVSNGQTLRIERGAHRFELRENGAVVANGTLTVQSGQQHTITLNRTVQAPPPNDPNAMIPGNVQTFTGELRPGDSQGQDMKYFDTYTFTWNTGVRVRLDLDSSDMDTYLVIRSPTGVERSNDDRGDGTLNSTLDLTLAETGQYTVTCTTFAANATGDYTLTVRGP
ncbi:MAG: hypothetical protein R3B82_28565 [Sandaracinaceae bacterium]